jgi:hypothetical protein
MGPERPDDLNEWNLDALYQQRFHELADSDNEKHSCRDGLAVLIEERWRELAMRSCHERKAANPEKVDALRAFESIKYQFFAKNIDLFSFSLPELWRATLNMTLRDWLKALSIVAVVISTIAGIAFWAGSKFGK